ncbi:PepSY-associated TM helix domain-containing protein [Methyloglobulus morosus KoM1]|uniref:PepSY-associated TM helix domain-containing protein n=1 Tax=Methyloglobulus morosus KoM1 TaxID=1116472 RepID=V5BX25_9GAMM|nr:PepSY domain-containing protein [Methyloglobulus morosus]ESS72414.1 PepSY-associated TM helix domain-containing protein [Methyloglobulus morosus KoM1]
MKLLYQVHRWVGVILALFMFFWFLTGLVVMYSTPTTQNRSQQFAHAETLAPEIGWLSLGEAWERSAEQRKVFVKTKPKPAVDSSGNKQTVDNDTRNANGDDSIGIAEARLVRSAGEPLWLIEDTNGLSFALSALDGKVRETSVEQALKIAENWSMANARSGNSKASYLQTLKKPIILRNQDALSPFHRIAFDDGVELLISTRTGEVLHASTRLDRIFFRAGNWLHLFKPLESIGLGHIREDVQMWLGLAATVGTLTGLIIGWLRWRPGFRGKPTYSKGRTQPYRESWAKWHFWSGLLGGSVALSWALSGFIDTNPGKLFSQPNPTRQELTKYLGNEFPEIMRNWQPILPLLLATGVDGADIVEMAWRHIGSESVLLAYSRDGHRVQPTMEGTATQISTEALLSAVARAAGMDKIASQEVINDYDSYYYPRHHQSSVEKPLPVLRVQLADEQRTRFYLDPQDGRLLAKMDRSRRVYRWLYSGLHHWDFGWLYHRPIWDLWMLTWVLFGLLLGASSIVLGWRRLGKTFVPIKQQGSSGGASRRYLSRIHQQ